MERPFNGGANGEANGPFNGAVGCRRAARTSAARGDAVLLAGTVEEALTIITTKRFCYAVVDQQLPWQAGEQAFVSGGEHVMRQIRAASSRRSESRYALPIVAMTRYLVDSDADRDRIADFIAKMHELGANAFVEKPLDAKNMEKLLDKIRIALDKAGRAEHASCEAAAPKDAKPERAPAPAAEEVEAAASGPRLFVDGVTTRTRCSGVLVNGERRSLQDSKFVVLVRLVLAHERARGTWSDRSQIGVGDSHNATTQLREVFAGLVPEGFKTIESDGRGNVRLNPDVLVEGIDLEALTEHPDAAVKRVVLEEKRRRGRG